MAGEQVGAKYGEVWETNNPLYNRGLPRKSIPSESRPDWVLRLMVAALIVILLYGLVFLPGALIYALLWA